MNRPEAMQALIDGKRITHALYMESFEWLEMLGQVVYNQDAEELGRLDSDQMQEMSGGAWERSWHVIEKEQDEAEENVGLLDVLITFEQAKVDGKIKNYSVTKVDMEKGEIHLKFEPIQSIDKLDITGIVIGE